MHRHGSSGRTKFDYDEALGTVMQSRIKHLLAACFFVGGATSLILEVAWAKELSYSLGNTVYAVSTSIAAFMAGLAFGSHLASRYLGSVRHPVLVYAGLQLAIGLCGAVSIPVLRATPPLLVSLHGALAELPTVFFVCRFAFVFVLMVVPVTLMGMTLPLMAGIYGRAKERYDFETGMLYGVNTLGAVSGCLLVGFALIPNFGLLARVSRSAFLRVAQLELLIALAVMLARTLYSRLPRRYGTLCHDLPEHSAWAALVAQSAIATVVVLPATLLMGALFPGPSSISRRVVAALGRPEEARAAIERGLTYNPGDPLLLAGTR